MFPCQSNVHDRPANAVQYRHAREQTRIALRARMAVPEDFHLQQTCALNRPAPPKACLPDRAAPPTDLHPCANPPAMPIPDSPPLQQAVPASSDRLLAIAINLRCSLQDLVGDQPRILTDRRLDALSHLRMLFEEILGVLTPLADALAVKGKPCP